MPQLKHRSTAWRREISDAIFTDVMRACVLAAVRAGVPLVGAMEVYGLAAEIAYGRARWDAEWEKLLHDAQMAGRDPEIDHGTAKGYRLCRTRCPECRAIQPGCTRARRARPEGVEPPSLVLETSALPLS